MLPRAKLKVLIDREVKLFGSPFDSNPEFVAVARAMATHFGRHNHVKA
jgi:hypothetical protein